MVPSDDEKTRIKALNQTDRNAEVRAALQKIRVAATSGTPDVETIKATLDQLDWLVPADSATEPAKPSTAFGATAPASATASINQSAT